MTAWRAMWLALLLAVPAASADWLQTGVDPQRTGDTGLEPMAWPDIALNLQLPVQPGDIFSAPVVLGRTAFILVNAFIPGSDTVTGSNQVTLFALSLDDGTFQAVPGPAYPASLLASDGELLFVADNGKVFALDSAGQERWNRDTRLTDALDPAPLNGLTLCYDLLVEAGKLYVACHEQFESSADTVSCFVVENGSPCGGWRSDLNPPTLQRPPSSDTNFLNEALSIARSTQDSPNVQAMRLSKQGEWISLAISDAPFLTGDTTRPLARLLALRFDPAEARVVFSTSGNDVPTELSDLDGITELSMPAAVSNANYTFAKGATIVRRNPSNDPGYYDASAVVVRDSVEGDLGSGFALRGDTLWYTTLRKLGKISTDSLGLDARFQTIELPPTESWAPGPLYLTQDALVAWSVDATGGATVRSYDATTGAPHWSHRFDEPQFFALADGLVVAVDANGKLAILGTTPSSPQSVAYAHTLYPQAQEIVELDLSASSAGTNGTRLDYAVDWGDGAFEGWQAEPRFSHRYAADGDRAARAFVRNELGQTGSAPLTFFVGQDDPSKTLLNDPFSDKYQNTSFFVLGLLATGIAALFGILRAGRKRRRFHRELRELEAQWESRPADAAEAEAILARRRSLARSLFLEKKLEEAHASFLERRVEELQRGLRAGAVDEQLRFLSHGLVLRLKRLLADGRVDAAERGDFLDALRHEKGLSETERSQVRRLVESWFLRDTDRPS